MGGSVEHCIFRPNGGASILIEHVVIQEFLYLFLTNQFLMFPLCRSTWSRLIGLFEHSPGDGDSDGNDDGIVLTRFWL